MRITKRRAKKRALVSVFIGLTASLVLVFASSLNANATYWADQCASGTGYTASLTSGTATCTVKFTQTVSGYTIPSVAKNIKFLVVGGGGGGGGGRGGGGGGGGVAQGQFGVNDSTYGDASSVSQADVLGKSLDITVGSGAYGGASSGERGGAGGASKISLHSDANTIYVEGYGGGGGGYHKANDLGACMGGAGDKPVSGPKLVSTGSGAGAAMNYAAVKCIAETWTAVPAGSVTLKAGNYGGESFRNSDNVINDTHRFSGGGAGAGGIGAGYTGTSATWDSSKKPNGGEGVTSAILSGTFGSGAGGADAKTAGDTERGYYTAGGGIGGTNAGNGECVNTYDNSVSGVHTLQNVSSGTANFGGGGGGGVGAGGSGGSGVVALQFSLKPTLDISGANFSTTYSGNPIAYPVSSLSGGSGQIKDGQVIASANISYQGTGSTVYSYTSTPPTNAGTYIVFVSNVYLTPDVYENRFPASDFYAVGYSNATMSILKNTASITGFTADYIKGAGDADTTITDPATSPSGGTYVYASSDPTVVSVSGKKLSYLKAGTATISAVFTPTDTANWYQSDSRDLFQVTVKDRFTVTFMKEDATTTAFTSSVLRGENLTIPAGPSDTGTFVGWYDSSSGGTRYRAYDVVPSVQSALTFYERRVRAPSVQMSVKVGSRTTETFTQSVTRGLTVGQAAVMTASATSPDTGSLTYAWGYSNQVSQVFSSGSLGNSTTSATQSPSAAGTYNYTVTVTNTVDGVTATKQLTFTATVSTALSFSSYLNYVDGTTRTSSLIHKDKDGVVIPSGTALTTGGLAPITFNWTGNPIPGITFDTSTGKFSGSPTASGIYGGEVWATDANGFSRPSYEICTVFAGVNGACRTQSVEVTVVKAKLDVPSAPTVVVDSPTSMVVTLHGTVADAASYTVTATPSSGTTETFTNFVSGSQITGLAADTTYDITVTAVPSNSEYLESNPSTAATATTYKWFYTTTYDANGGTFTGGATTSTADQYWDPSSTIVMLTGSDLPARAGYVFTGWATTSTGQRANIDSDYVFSPPSTPANTTYYAVWGPKPTALTVKTTDNAGTYTTTNASNGNYADSVDVYFTEHSGAFLYLEGLGTGSGTLSYLFEKKLATDSSYSTVAEDSSFTSLSKHGIRLAALAPTTTTPHKLLFTLTNTDLYTPSTGATRTILVNIYVAAAQTLSYSFPTFLEKNSAVTYSVTRTGGKSGYTYAVASGSLPAGLSLNASTGQITGTPTTLGSNSFTVSSTDANGDVVSTSSISAPVKTTLVASAPTSVTRASDTTLTVNFPAVTNAASYIVRVYDAANGGTQVGTDWTSFTAGTNNTITGLTQNSTYYVGVTAVGSGNYVSSAESARVSATTYKTNYNVTWDTLGGSSVSATTYAWNGSITKPASNPTRAGYEFEGWGLATNTTYGARLFTSGSTYTPPSVGDITIYAIWSDYAALDYTYTITGKSAVTVNATATSNTIRVSVPRGVSISFSTSASVQRGGTITYGWGYSSDGGAYSQTGTNSTFSISNIPAGGLIVDLDVKNSDAYSPLGLIKTVRMEIVSAADLTLSYPSTSSGEVTKALIVNATQGGGASPFTYAVASGALPAGLTLNTSSGQINGNPTAVESQVISIKVTDANGTVTTSSPFTITSTLIARTLTFNAAYTTKTIGQTQQLIFATLSPNGVSSTGTFSFSAGASTACTVNNSGLVTITHGTGTCAITESLSQSGNYAAATTATPATIPVGLAAQSITVATGDTTYGTNPALASSGSTGTGAVTYTKVSGPCAISDTVLRTTGAGNCVITATIAADTDYASATSAQKTIVIAPKPITVSANVTTASVVYGSTLPTLSYSTVAGALVGTDHISSVGYKYSAADYPSSATAPTNVGTYTVTPWNAWFNSGYATDYSITYATATFDITQATPTFTAPSNITKTFGDADFTLPTPTSSTTGTWSYASSSDSVVRVTGSTASIQKVGSVTVTATFTPGNTTNYSSGGTATFTITVGALALAKPAAPTVTSGNVTNATTAAWSFVADANATSYVLRIYSTPTGGTPSLSSVTSTSGFTTGLSANTSYYYSVSAIGYGNYSTSPESDRTLFKTRSVRTIAFATTSYVARFNDTLTVAATASAGTGAVTYSAGSSTACSVASTTGVVRMTAASGTCSINATVDADTNYIQVTTSVPVTVSTGKAIPTFGAWSGVSKIYGDSAFALSPPSVDNSVTGTWAYTSATPSVLSITGSTATVGVVGTSLITATFTPTGAYATSYTTGTTTMTASVSAASRTLSFATTSYTVTYGQTQTVTASPSAGSGDGAVTYDAGTSTACTVGASTGVVTMTSGTGSCSITASIAAGTNYASANTTTPVTITPAKASPPTFTASDTNKTFGDSAFTLTSPTTSLSGSWGFAVASGSSVTLSGSTATIVGAGTSTITATFTPGGTDASNYNSGSINLDVVVAQKALTITASVSSSTQVYGATTPTVSYSSVGLVSPNTISSVVYRYTGSWSHNSTVAPVTVGSYNVTPESAVFSSGSASNYNITYVAAQYSITKATPVATAPSNITKGYGNADFSAPVPVISPAPAGTWTFSSSSSSVVRVTGATLSVLRLGTVTITATFAPTDTINYTGVSATFDVTVNPTTLATPAAPSVTAVAGSAAANDFAHLDLTWAAVSNASSYVVNMYNNSSTNVIATQTITGATSAIFKSYTTYGSYLVLSTNTTYRFTVQAVGDGTNYLSSANSNYGSATTQVGPVNPGAITISTSGTLDSSGTVSVVRTNFGSTLTLTANATVADGGTKTYSWTYWNGSGWVQSPSGTLGSTSQTLSYSNIPITKNGERLRIYVYNKLNGFTSSPSMYELVLAVSKQTPAVAATSTVSRTITAGTHTITDAVVTNAAGSTLTGTWSYVTSSSAIRISGNTVNLDSIGTATIVGTFTPTDTTNYNTTSTTITLTIAAASQTISVTPTTATYGSDTTLTTTGESGTGSKTFSLVSGPCTLNGSTLHPTAIGTCVVNVTIASDTNYASATSADLSITVNAASRTIAFSTTSYSKAYGSTQTVTATPSVGSGTITYSAGASDACSVNASTGVVTITAASGTCSVSATITASGNYTSASTTTPATITVGKETPTFSAFSNLSTDMATALTLVGQTASLTGGTWSYSSSNTSVVSINSATASPAGVGTATITATYTPSLLDQSNYSSASGTFTITVTAATLQTPSAPTVTAGANGIVMNATWSTVSHASGYLVTLYPNGSITPIGTTQVGSGTNSASFSSVDYPVMTYSTTYRVTVKAIGDGSTFLDSAESAFGSAQSIAVTADPTYTVLSNVITTYPGTATFNAAAVSPDNGDLSYVWQYQLPGVSSTWSPVTSSPSGFNVSGRTSATLSLSNISTSISGYKFRVVITNTKNSNTATISTTAASVTVNKQTPTFGTINTVNVIRGAASQSVASPTAKDSLNADVTGSWSYTSSDTNVATISNTNLLNFATPGTATITATFTPGDSANFNGGTKTFTVNVAKTAQTISVSTTSAVYLSDSTLTTSGTTGSGAISYTKVSGPCTITGDQLHPTGAGTCVVNASIATDTNYAAATSANQSINIAKANRVISFGATTSYSKYYGQTQTVTATTADGTGAITYSYGNSTACTVDAQTGVVTITAASGTCSITATIAADNDYNSATTSTPVTFNVSKRPLTLTGHVSTSSVAYNTAIPTNSYTISSGSVAGTDILASVTYIYTGINNYNSNAPPANTGTWTVTPTAAVFTSGQADNYDITYVAASFDIVKADQTVSIGIIGAQTMTAGSVITQYSATSGLHVTVTTTTPAKCSVGSDNVIYIIAVGTCTIEANQSGNGNWNAAPVATKSFTIVPDGQVITFASLADKTFGDTAFTVSATSNSNLTVTFASATTPVCTVSGSTVTILAAGTCTINADQAGNATYSPATRVTRSFTVANAAVSNPSILSAVATAGVLKSISVSWTSVSHISGYVLRLYPASGTTSVADIAVSGSTSRVITASDYAQLADGTDYRVSISAIGAVNYSDSSESAKSSLTTNSAYTITYKSNGSTAGSAPAAGTYITGAAATVIATNSGNLVRTGYTFAGWNTLAAGTGTNYTANGTGTFANTENIDLYPVWTPNQITITFNANYGTTPSTSTQVFTADASAGLAFNAFNRAGYMFDGWALTSTGAVAYTDGASFSTIVPLTLYAKWTAREYTVTYQTNGGTGTAPTENTKHINDVLTVKAVGGINKTGYDFVGWSDGSNIYAAGDSYTMPAGNVIFTAQWRVQVYTITYDTNHATSGSPASTSDTFTYGYPAMSLTTPGSMLRTGYSFAGWSVVADGTPISGNYTPTSSITLYAVWSANTYTISYNSNGAGGTLAQVSDQYTTGGTAVTLPGAGTLAKTGYTFGGWSSSASGGAISGTYTTADDVTLYARWVAINYTITYNANGGATTPTESSKNIGDSFNLAVGPTKANYHFAGWSDGNSTYSEGYRYTVGSSDLTFTAVWVRVYWIHYNFNGANETAPADLRKLDQDSYTTSEAVTRAGYTFAGWKATGSNGANSQNAGLIAAGDTFTVDIDHYILSAQWNAIDYHVTYSSVGGVGVPTQADKNIGQTFSVGSAPTRAGYTFDGWSDGNLIYGPGATYSVGTSNIAFTAQWTAIQYDVTYNLSSGTSTPPVQAARIVDQTFVVAARPTRYGYTFDKWSDGTNDYQPGDNFTMPAHDVTLTAQWSRTLLSVAYDLNGGTSNTPTESNKGIGDIFGLAAAATWINHTFLGWFDGTNTYAAGSNYTASGENINFVARWINNLFTAIFNPGGATGNGPANIDKEAGSAFTMPGYGAFAKDGYSFSGWTDGAQAYAIGDTAVMTVGGKEFTATWLQNPTPAPPSSGGGGGGGGSSGGGGGGGGPVPPSGGGGSGGGTSGGGSGGGATGGGSSGTPSNATAIVYGSKKKLAAPAAVGTPIKWTATGSTCKVDTKGVLSTVSVGNCTVTAVYKSTLRIARVYKYVVKPRLKISLKSISNLKPTSARLNAVVAWPGTDFQAKFCVATAITSTDCKFISSISVSNENTSVSKSAVTVARDIQGLTPGTTYYIHAAVIVNEQQYQTATQLLRTPAKAAPAPIVTAKPAPVVKSSSTTFQFATNVVALQESQTNAILESIVLWKKSGYKTVTVSSAFKRDFNNYFVVARLQAIANFIKAQNAGVTVNLIFPKETSGRLIGDVPDSERAIFLNAR